MLHVHRDSFFGAFCTVLASFGWLDRHPKGGYSALKHVETGTQFGDFDTLDYFIKRPLETSKTAATNPASSAIGVLLSPAPPFRIGISGPAFYDHRVLGGQIGHLPAGAIPEWGLRSSA